VILPIGEIWHWIEKDGSLVVRRDGLRGPITSPPQKKYILNIK